MTSTSSRSSVESCYTVEISVVSLDNGNEYNAYDCLILYIGYQMSALIAFILLNILQIRKDRLEWHTPRHCSHFTLFQDHEINVPLCIFSYCKMFKMW